MICKLGKIYTKRIVVWAKVAMEIEECTSMIILFLNQSVSTL